MAVKFAMEIAKGIRERGSIMVPEGYVTGEAFENWLYESSIFIESYSNKSESIKNTIMADSDMNFFSESYGDAA